MTRVPPRSFVPCAKRPVVRPRSAGSRNMCARLRRARRIGFWLPWWPGRSRAMAWLPGFCFSCCFPVPGAWRAAGGLWGTGTSAAATIAAVYERIRRYPLERRPARVAANVLMDAGLDLRHAARAIRPTVGLSRELSEPPAEHPAVELADLLVDAVADGIISASDAELIAASRIAGVRLADLAVRRRRHLRTLQY